MVGWREECRWLLGWREAEHVSGAVHLDAGRYRRFTASDAAAQVQKSRGLASSLSTPPR